MELAVRWRTTVREVTPRQVEALRTYARTGTVSATAEALDLTPARIYAIFGQVARRLGISARLLRVAVLDGSVDLDLEPGPGY